MNQLTERDKAFCVYYHYQHVIHDYYQEFPFCPPAMTTPGTKEFQAAFKLFNLAVETGVCLYDMLSLFCRGFDKETCQREFGVQYIPFWVYMRRDRQEEIRNMLAVIPDVFEIVKMDRVLAILKAFPRETIEQMVESGAMVGNDQLLKEMTLMRVNGTISRDKAVHRLILRTL